VRIAENFLNLEKSANVKRKKNRKKNRKNNRKNNSRINPASLNATEQGDKSHKAESRGIIITEVII
jgi:hypothetical protein